MQINRLGAASCKSQKETITKKEKITQQEIFSCWLLHEAALKIVDLL